MKNIKIKVVKRTVKGDKIVGDIILLDSVIGNFSAWKDSCLELESAEYWVGRAELDQEKDDKLVVLLDQMVRKLIK